MGLLIFIGSFALIAVIMTIALLVYERKDRRASERRS